MFGVGPNRLPILSYQVELSINWVNMHSSFRLPDDFTMPGVVTVGDLVKCESWLFPWSSIAFISFPSVQLHIPVIFPRLSQHYRPLADYSSM